MEVKKIDNKLKVVSIRLVEETPLLSNESVDSPQKAVELLGSYLNDMDREVFCVVNFDASLKPINCNFVSVGALDCALVFPREVFKSSILSNAASIMILHNHVSGNLFPSKNDYIITEKIKASCELLGIGFVDHIIVGRNKSDYFSFKSDGDITIDKQKTKKNKCR